MEDLKRSGRDLTGRPSMASSCEQQKQATMWMPDWQSLLQSEGYAAGKANPALLFNTQRNPGDAVHGDAFYVLANTRSHQQSVGI